MFCGSQTLLYTNCLLLRITTNHYFRNCRQFCMFTIFLANKKIENQTGLQDKMSFWLLNGSLQVRVKAQKREWEVLPSSLACGVLVWGIKDSSHYIVNLSASLCMMEGFWDCLSRMWTCKKIRFFLKSQSKLKLFWWMSTFSPCFYGKKTKKGLFLLLFFFWWSKVSLL